MRIYAEVCLTKSSGMRPSISVSCGVRFISQAAVVSTGFQEVVHLLGYFNCPASVPCAVVD
jgi:hypothetical protein